MQATRTLDLDARLLRREVLAAVPEGRVLGVVAFGGMAVETAGAPLVRMPLDRLGSAGPAPELEVWQSPDPEAPVAVGRHGAVELARDGRVLFGHLRAPAVGPRLEPATQEAYRQVFAATGAEGYPHLLRVWASVPDIHGDEDGMERYRGFCRARAAAFEEAWGSGFARRLPAATAVGADAGGDGGGDDLVVYVLAARTPGVHVENPRQVAAYDYPDLYGLRSPSFARATRASTELGDLLFVSGTASIVGHASVHRDLGEQTRETVRNLERVREVAQEGDRRFAWSLFKVYLRRESDEPEVRRLLSGLLPPSVPTLFLRADVCRRELLIEIEAIARPV